MVSSLDFSKHRTGPHSMPLESLSQSSWQLGSAVLTQSCLTLCNPVDYTLPGSSVYGVFQARVLEQVAISDLPDPRMEPKSQASPALAGGFFTTGAPGKLWLKTECRKWYSTVFHKSVFQKLEPRRHTVGAKCGWKCCGCLGCIYLKWFEKLYQRDEIWTKL